MVTRHNPRPNTMIAASCRAIVASGLTIDWILAILSPDRRTWLIKAAMTLFSFSKPFEARMVRMPARSRLSVEVRSPSVYWLS